MPTVTRVAVRGQETGRAAPAVVVVAPGRAPEVGPTASLKPVAISCLTAGAVGVPRRLKEPTHGPLAI